MHLLRVKISLRHSHLVGEDRRPWHSIISCNLYIRQVTRNLHPAGFCSVATRAILAWAVLIVETLGQGNLGETEIQRSKRTKRACPNAVVTRSRLSHYSLRGSLRLIRAV